jgi:hypothetical protein
MIIDPFKADGFSLNSLTAALIAQPYTPTILADSGLFSEAGVTTLDVSVESDGKTIGLVSVQPRNAPPQNVTSDKRSIRSFRVPHLPERSTIMADEVQGIRSFGSENQARAINEVRDGRLAKMKAQIDYTIEAHRLSALQGQYYDAAGNLSSLFTEFGVTQQTVAMALPTAGTVVKLKVAQILETIEAQLDGIAFTGVTVYCGTTFFKSFVNHPNVEKFYMNWQAANTLNTDPRAAFPFMGMSFVRYRGSSAVKIADTEAYAVPTGVRDLFITRFAPANFVEAVNTQGLPYYAKMEPMEMNKGIIIEAQSNPINLCTRPSAVIKLTET